VDLMDLVQDGNEALLHALEKYDQGVRQKKKAADLD